MFPLTLDGLGDAIGAPVEGGRHEEAVARLASVWLGYRRGST